MKVKRNRKRDKKEEERQLTRTLLARLAKSCFLKLAITWEVLREFFIIVPAKTIYQNIQSKLKFDQIIYLKKKNYIIRSGEAISYLS